MPRPSAHRVYLQQSTKEKWKFYTGYTTCAYGSAEETTAHMLQCSQLAHPCSFIFNDAGKQCAELWTIWFDDTTMMMMTKKDFHAHSCGVLSPTFTLQTYHHPEHRFSSWPTQMTSPSHLHTQARVQPRNTYNHTYIKFLPGQNKTISH